MATAPGESRLPYGTVGWTWDDGTIHIVLAGEIDLSHHDEINKAAAAITDAMPRDVLIEVTDVTFVGSEGLRLLAEAIRTATVDNHKTVTLHNPDAQFTHAVHLVGMLEQITITGNR